MERLENMQMSIGLKRSGLKKGSPGRQGERSFQEEELCGKTGRSAGTWTLWETGWRGEL
jgi:hypothetical protein